MSGYTPDELVEMLTPYFVPRGAMGNGWELIEALELSLGAGTFSFTNISAIYNHLWLVGSLRADRGSEWDTTRMRFNADAAGTSYGWKYIDWTNLTTAAGAVDISDDEMTIWWVNGNTSDADAFSAVEAYIPNYADTNRHKMVHGRSAASGDYSAVTDFFVSEGMGVWYSKAAINRIDVSAANGDDFLQYSNLYLYGVT